MPQTREEKRTRWTTEYQELFDATSALFFRHDPIGIAFGPSDEYEPEAGTILPRLHSCCSEADVCRIVHEEFMRWFGADIAGSPECYRQIAVELWTLWRKFAAAYAY